MEHATEKPHTLVAVYRNLSGRWNGVTVDLERNTIRFEGCFLPRRFLTLGGESAEMPLADVLAVFVLSRRGRRQLTIATKTGKAYLPDSASNFSELHGLLRELSRHTPRAKMTDSPISGLAFGLAFTLGLCLGLVLTPTEASIVQTTVYVATGAGLGGAIGILGLAVWNWMAPS